MKDLRFVSFLYVFCYFLFLFSSSFSFFCKSRPSLYACYWRMQEGANAVAMASGKHTPCDLHGLIRCLLSRKSSSGATAGEERFVDRAVTPPPFVVSPQVPWSCASWTRSTSSQPTLRPAWTWKGTFPFSAWSSGHSKSESATSFEGAALSRRKPGWRCRVNWKLVSARVPHRLRHWSAIRWNTGRKNR